MIKLSQEQVEKPFYVKHVTENKYKYPKIDLENEVQGGFGSNAYGYGFYTSNNDDVIKGYMGNKANTDAYVRKQKIPAGAKYLYLKEVPTYLVKDWVISNNLDKWFDLNNTTINLSLAPDLLLKYNFSKYARGKGIDLLKYDAFEIYDTNKKNKKGYNWLIINPDILNIKNKEDDNDDDFNKKTETDNFKSIVKAHPQKREWLFHNSWKKLTPEQIYYLLDNNMIKFKWVVKSRAYLKLDDEKMKALSYKNNLPLGIRYYNEKELINLCKFKKGYYYKYSDSINERLNTNQIFDIYSNIHDNIKLSYFPTSIYHKIVKHQLTKTISEFDQLYGRNFYEMQKVVDYFITNNKEFVSKNPRVANRIMAYFTDLIPDVVNINPEFIIYIPYRMDELLKNLIVKNIKYYQRNPKSIQHLLFHNNIDPNIVHDFLPMAFAKYVKYNPGIEDDIENYDYIDDSIYDDDE